MSEDPCFDFQSSIQILIQIINSDLRYLNLCINPNSMKLMASYFLNYIQELCKGIAVFILLIVLCVRITSPLKKSPQTFKSSVWDPDKSPQGDVDVCVGCSRPLRHRLLQFCSCVRLAFRPSGNSDFL